MLAVNFYEILPTNQCKLIANVECLEAKKQQTSKTRAVNGKLGDACLIPVDEPARQAIVVTTGIKPSSNIGNALVSAMYGRSSELGLYLWGNPPLPTVQGLPPPVGGG